MLLIWSLHDRALKFLGSFSEDKTAGIVCSTVRILKLEKRFLAARVTIFRIWIFLAI